MKSEHVLGNACISISSSPVNPEEPVNPKTLQDVQGFMSVLQKAYVLYEDLTFRKLLQGFLEEVDGFLDERRLEKKAEMPEEAPDVMPSMDDLEKFLDEMEGKKRGKK